ncbi:MAG: DMT family transporter [Planctomycetes bacterium]|nr:DMT family transporter [Planctomycetota bacterium]
MRAATRDELGAEREQVVEAPCRAPRCAAPRAPRGERRARGALQLLAPSAGTHAAIVPSACGAGSRPRTVPDHVQDVSKARLALVAAAVLFSSGGALIKGTELGAWQVACYRSLVAAVAFLLLVPAARRIPSRGEWLVGVAYATTLVLFVLANKQTTAASTIYLQSTAPLHILLFAPLVLGERATRRDLPFLVVMGIAFALLVLGTPPAQRTAPDPALGNALAIGSGFAWAFTVMGLRRLERAGGGRPGGGAGAVVAGNLIAAAATAPLALPVVGSLHPDWTTIAFLGVVQIALAYRGVTYGLARVPALEASLILLVEPVLAPLWAWLAHGETPGVLAIAGGALVAAATTWKGLIDARRPAGTAAA